MARLSLHFLGAFQVTLDGEPITSFRSDKERALLAYLAVESDRPHRRDSLAGLLWPDYSDRQARNNLRQTLFRLRQTIGDTDEQPAYLLVDQESLQFNLQSAWLDVSEFTRRIHQADSHAHQNLDTCQECMTLLKTAANLYQGDFLSGLYLDDSPAFSEWAALKREWLHIKVLQTLNALASHYQRLGEPDKGINHAHRQLELEPWREETHQQIMGFLARSGQYSAALKQYETCQRVLMEELGLEPSRETTELYERILMAREKPRHNLPAPATSFIGRKRELSQVRDYLANPNCRLVTILGPGGIGKSRLALQAAQEMINAFLNGVFLVPLAETRSAEQLPSKIAEALGLNFHEQEKPEIQLLNYLRNKEMLLILDNFEFLLGSRKLLSKMLANAPGLNLLITSLQRLGLQEERVLLIEGLECPPDNHGEDLTRYSAVNLLLRRAQRVYPDFDLNKVDPSAVVGICHLVEGMPLALELAAAWMHSLPLDQIISKIEQNLNFLAATSSDIAARHQSVMVAFEHSWSLLAEEEKIAFMKLAVFRGSFDQPAAQAIANAALPTLTSLVDKSLLRRRPLESSHATVRYDLHELIHKFATHKLAENPVEMENAAEQHARYYLDFTHQQAASLQGGDQIQAIEEIRLELENLRAALDWAVSHQDLDGIARAMDLFYFYDLTGRFLEASEDFEKITRAVAISIESADQSGLQKASLYAMALAFLAWNKMHASDFEEAWSLCLQGLALARKIEDDQAITWNTYVKGMACLMSGDHDQASECFDACLVSWGETQSKYWQAKCLNDLGRTFFLRGKHEAAHHFLNRGLFIHSELGDKLGMSISHSRLAEVATAIKDYAQAERHLEDCLYLLGDYLPYWKAITMKQLGDIAYQRGQFNHARHHLQESLLIFKDTGIGFRAAETMISYGKTNVALGRHRQAWELLREALRFAMESRPGLLALKALVVIGNLLIKEERFAQAIEVLAFVVDAPSVDHQTREQADQLLDELESKVPAETFTPARERAAMLDLQNLAAQFL